MKNLINLLHNTLHAFMVEKPLIDPIFRDAEFADDGLGIE